MVDASGLIEALGRDDLDQRAVADHLVLLAKGLKGCTAQAAPAEPGSPTTPALSAQAPTATAVEVALPPPAEQLNAASKASTATQAVAPVTAPAVVQAPAQAETQAETRAEAQAEAQAETKAEVQAEKQADAQSGSRGVGDEEVEKKAQVQDAKEGSGAVPGEAQPKLEVEPSRPLQPLQQKVKDKPAARGDLLLELIRSFRGGMLRVDSKLRAAMFRSLRYLVRTSEDAEVIRRQRFGLFIALALAREQYELWERMQALKLVKQIISVDSSKLPREVVRTVVAVSGHKEDNFRRVCLDTLRELAVADPRMVAHANGFRVLLAAASDPATQDLAEPLMTTLMSILEDPSTRHFVRPHLGLHQLLTGFTDLDAPPGPERANRWMATRRALVVALRSWAGVHLLASDSRGLVTLMRLLRDPSASFSEDAGLQDSILETIMDVFLPLVGMGRASPSGAGSKPRRTSFVDKAFTPFSGSTATLPQKSTGPGLRTRKGSESHNLLLSYATIVCAAFVHCGLIPSLTTLSISAGSEELRAKAATLLVEVLHLCAMLLSQNQCTRLLSMPGLVQIAAESQTGSMAAAEGGARTCHLTRSRASRASDLIRLLHGALGAGARGLVAIRPGQHHQMDPSTATIGGIMQKVYEAGLCLDNLEVSRARGWEPTGTLEKMRKELRLSIESTVERSVMDNQLNKSKVLTTKDWTKWDWDVVNDIVQDTLPHPPRLLDALRTKWIKRVSGFYRFVGAGNSGTSTDRGGGGGLHNIRWDVHHIRHIACAGRLYSLLLQQPEGVIFLQQDVRGGILQEIVKELHGLVTRRWNGSGSVRLTGASKVFDMESCQRRLSGEYFTLLFSVAAGTDPGQELLVKAGLWNHLSSMGSQPELDYMSRLVLTRIDLNSDKFIPRDLLKSWMTTGSSHLQLFSINLLRSVLREASAVDSDSRDPALAARAGNATSSEDYRAHELCIETMVAQLNSNEPAVARAALSVLEEATSDERCLRYLVLAKPDLTDKPGTSNLLMRFLSIPEGIQYLEQLGWVERMVREWKDEGCTARYSASVDATWKAHVNDAEVVENSLDMERVSGRRGNARNESGASIPIRTSSIPVSMSQDMATGGAWDGRDMRLLMSLPWNIEVTLSRDSIPTAGIQLRLDTWLDTSPEEEVPSTGTRNGSAGTPGATTLVVRGILVDSAGRPTCHPLEAHMTLHARLCLGSCPVDRRGNVHGHPTSPKDKQTAPFGRNRTSRTSRSQWSPQHGRSDHSTYAGSTIYRGVQGLQDFGPGREMPEDPSDVEHQLFWSTCRPHHRMDPAPVVVQMGSDTSKDGGQPGLGVRTISPLSTTLHDEVIDAEDREVLVSSAGVGEAGRGNDIAGVSERTNARVAGGGHERVVRVPKETARWVFTDQPEAEDTISMQVVENTSVTYLKAVEMTISLKDVGPPAILLPPHLYGELAKTERGCELLRQHGDLKMLLHLARNSGAPADDRKGALWAVAHVSSWPLGLSLLEELHEDIIGMLLSLCTAESHLSVWGTSFCVVSLVARTARGRAAIRAAGWESARDPSTSVFLPQDPTVLFQPVPWKFEGSLTQGLDEQPSDPVIERLWQDLPERDADVLHQVAKLSSHISRKEAMKKLSRMRKDKGHKDSFTKSLPVFLLVHQLLADYRYIFELFDQPAPGSSNWERYIA